MGSENKQDMSSFMSVLIMTIGCLTILLVANTLIIASNPENVQITSMIDPGGAEGNESTPLFGNKLLNPNYIDVHRDHVIIYPEGDVIRAGDLEAQNNAFSVLLNRMEQLADEEYIVLVLRPHSAVFSRRLKKLIRSRGVKMGQELYAEDQELRLQTGSGGEEEEEASSDETSTGGDTADDATPVEGGNESPPADDGGEGATEEEAAAEQAGG